MPVAEGTLLSPIVNAYAKLVAIGHLVAGAGLAWIAAWILGPLWQTMTRGPGVLALVPPLLIVAALAAWFTLLGIRLWRRTPGWSTAVRWTHAVVLAFAALQLAGGWVAIRGAERSAAHGGGLLGGLGYFEVALGVALAGFALLSLPITFVASGSVRGTGLPPS
jgi:hypothetical protein